MIAVSQSLQLGSLGAERRVSNESTGLGFQDRTSSISFLWQRQTV